MAVSNQEEITISRFMLWLLSLCGTVILSLTAAWAMTVETAKTKLIETDQKNYELILRYRLEVQDLRKDIEIVNTKIDIMLKEFGIDGKSKSQPRNSGQ